MSRGKGKKKPVEFDHHKFVEVTSPDNDNSQTHLSPVPSGMSRNDPVRPVYDSAEVPVGAQVHVPVGMTVVPGCYVDSNGVMRFILNNAPAVWHHPSGCKYHQPPCKRRITNPADIVYDDNNAPWCPDCVGWGVQDVECKKREAFNESIGDVHDVTLEEAIGDFNEVGDEEFGGVQRVIMTEEDIQKLQAASYTGDKTKGLYFGFTGPRPIQFYPSGHPRKW